MSYESEKIPVEGSKAYWDKHPEWNDWTLQKDYFILGKKWGEDRSGIHIYGWVEEIEDWKPNAGMFYAGCPCLCDLDEDDPEWTDTRDLGVFDTIQEAMQAVIQSNHPDYSGISI